MCVGKHEESPQLSLHLYIHNMDRDTLRKVQTQHLWTAHRSMEAELGAARAADDAGRIEDAERVLEVSIFAAFEKWLLAAIQGKVDYTPPEWAEGPYRGGVYDPVLDDRVKVNFMSLQKEQLLRYKKLV